MAVIVQFVMLLLVATVAIVDAAVFDMVLFSVVYKKNGSTLDGWILTLETNALARVWGAVLTKKSLVPCFGATTKGFLIGCG